jgi:Arc/MetJ-type ribon-helix-helix transcriptional regulator
MESMVSPEARTFLEKLIEEKKFENLSPALKESMIESLNKRLEAYILTAITEQLSAENADKLNALTEGEGSVPTSAEMQSFIKQNVPNAQEVIAKAMLEFRSVYLNN